MRTNQEKEKRIHYLTSINNPTSREKRELSLLSDINTRGVADRILELEFKEKSPQEKRELELLFDPSSQGVANIVSQIEFKPLLTQNELEYLSRCYLLKLCHIRLLAPWEEHWHRFAKKLSPGTDPLGPLEKQNCHYGKREEMLSFSIFQARRETKLEVAEKVIDTVSKELVDYYFDLEILKKYNKHFRDQVIKNQQMQELHQKKMGSMVFVIRLYFSATHTRPFTFDNAILLKDFLKNEIRNEKLKLSFKDTEDLMRVYNVCLEWNNQVTKNSVEFSFSDTSTPNPDM